MRRQSPILLLPDYDCRVRSEQPVASRSLLALWLPWVTHGFSMLHSLSHSPSVCLFVSLLLIPSHSQLHSLPSSCFPLSFPPGLNSSSSLSCSPVFPNFMSSFWFVLFFFPSLSLSSWEDCLHWFPTLFIYIFFFFFTVVESLTSVECHFWSEAVSCYHFTIQQPQRQIGLLLIDL